MRNNVNSLGLHMFFGLSVVMTEQYVHLAVKNVVCLPQVLNVILKPNTKNYLEMIRRRTTKLLKKGSFS